MGLLLYLPAMMDSYASGRVSQNKLFLLHVAWLTVFPHSNSKVTNTPTFYVYRLPFCRLSHEWNHMWAALKSKQCSSSNLKILLRLKINSIVFGLFYLACFNIYLSITYFENSEFFYGQLILIFIGYVYHILSTHLQWWTLELFPFCGLLWIMLE